MLRSSQRRKGALAVLVVATLGLIFSGSVFAYAGGAEHSSVQKATAVSSSRDPSAATLQYVDKAVLPLARKFVRALRKARPSRKQVTRHTSQMYGKSHSNVTNISVTLPARGARKGEYVFFAGDFRGRIKPRNAVTLSLGAAPARGIDGVYSFSLSRSTYDNPGSSVYSSMHWLIDAFYGRGSRFLDHQYDSCAANGKLGGDFPIMSKTILAAGIRQASNVLRRATKRKPLTRQRDVFAGLTPATRCR